MSTSTWFKRIAKGILTSSKEKKEVPDGIWNKCGECKKTFTSEELKGNLWVCDSCNHHMRIDAAEYFSFLFDENTEKRLFENITSKDELGFVDLKPYDKRIVAAMKSTNLLDAMTVAEGKINSKRIVIAAMNFKFIGGSMGSVMGEKIARAIDFCIKNKLPLMIISKSGGARMMESAFSLMQMAKTSAKLTQLAKAKLPYISFLTDPTTGGVTASFAMLGDVNIAEPGALIAFAGPRVVKDTVKVDLPEGFQRSEFLLEHGFLDFIVERKTLKEKIANLIGFFEN
ncbi:MAG: acetyl-CoA carboxylase carboxyltransferase subunit beta [Chitinophagaceae bacterium]|nr:acetyl-CoA carboxylase carboxyltransferase subunit beta [Chitinophagaceae bacterium]